MRERGVRELGSPRYVQGDREPEESLVARYLGLATQHGLTLVLKIPDKLLHLCLLLSVAAPRFGSWQMSSDSRSQRSQYSSCALTRCGAGRARPVPEESSIDPRCTLNSALVEHASMEPRWSCSPKSAFSPCRRRRLQGVLVRCRCMRRPAQHTEASDPTSSAALKASQTIHKMIAVVEMASNQSASQVCRFALYLFRNTSCSIPAMMDRQDRAAKWQKKDQIVKTQ